ncbi:unnamed protein product [Staurois parvus]|uniref:Uncharacterized protein n=1 Tax=Staurois parvus TaxID=386267 RepID=A0ABN9ARR5_9NEOB|nr:unnamed protein product [Staurois parvus]
MAGPTPSCCGGSGPTAQHPWGIQVVTVVSSTLTLWTSPSVCKVRLTSSCPNARPFSGVVSVETEAPSMDISSSWRCEVPIASSSCSSCGADCCGQRSTTPCPDVSSSSGGVLAGSFSAEKSIKFPVSGTGV